MFLDQNFSKLFYSLDSVMLTSCEKKPTAKRYIGGVREYHSFKTLPQVPQFDVGIGTTRSETLNVVQRRILLLLEITPRIANIPWNFVDIT